MNTHTHPSSHSWLFLLAHFVGKPCIHICRAIGLQNRAQEFQFNQQFAYIFTGRPKQQAAAACQPAYMAGLASSSHSSSSTFDSRSISLSQSLLGATQCGRYGPLGEASVAANGTSAIDKLTDWIETWQGVGRRWLTAIDRPNRANLRHTQLHTYLSMYMCMDLYVCGATQIAARQTFANCLVWFRFCRAN